MKLLRSTLPLAFALAVALPTTAWAQGRGNGNGNGNKDKHENGRVVVIDRDGDGRTRQRDRQRIRVERRDRERVVVDRRVRDRDRFVLRNGGRTIVLRDDDFFWYPVRTDRGPSFCRSGAGHPVFGIQWCLQKGYGIGRPGAVFLWGDDVFLRDRTRVIVLRDRRYDADQAFWGAVVGQVLALVD
jgi:hypothetical protein